MIGVLAKRLRAIALVLSISSSIGCGCRTTLPVRAELIADSVGDFSGKQGAGGWSYGYWDRSTDTNATYDQTTDFRLLRHFGRDPINGLSGHSEFTTGELWYLQDGVYYTSLWAAGGHANAAMDLGKYARVEQWAVRRWVSTTGGRIGISGHVGKVMPWGKNWGGGCEARIVVDGEIVYRAPIENRPSGYEVDAVVKIGSLVDFLIGPSPSIGVVDFTGTVRRSIPRS